jgi:hypothetical protein
MNITIKDNEELHNLYALSYINRVVKSGGWETRFMYQHEGDEEYKILVGKPEETT